MEHVPPLCLVSGAAIASRLQSDALVGRVAELGSLVAFLSIFNERTRFPSRCRDDSSPENGALWSRPVLRADLYYDLGNRRSTALVPIASKCFAAFHEPLGENWTGKRSAILDVCCSLRPYRLGHLFDVPIFRQRRPAQSLCSACASSGAGGV